VCYSVPMEKTETPIAARFTLYKNDMERLCGFNRRAREYAAATGDSFCGLSFDVDEDGFITVYAAGLEPLKL
jgi:hypothetical protein